MKNGDFGFVDHGFRYVQQDLEDKYCNVLMPSLKINESLSCESIWDRYGSSIVI